MSDLFQAGEAPPAKEKEPPLPEQLRYRLARRKAGDLPGFKFYAFECIGEDALLLTGCVVTSTYSKGPRKGEPKYDGKPIKVVITNSEIAAEKARYEAETGRCGECVGDGREFARWDRVEGTTYRPCVECRGTGHAEASK